MNMKERKIFFFTEKQIKSKKNYIKQILKLSVDRIRHIDDKYIYIQIHTTLYITYITVSPVLQTECNDVDIIRNIDNNNNNSVTSMKNQLLRGWITNVFLLIDIHRLKYFYFFKNHIRIEQKR